MSRETVAPRDIARPFVRGALLYFVVIGVLGAWLRARFAGLFPLPFLREANVIHAHSHVAFFGWANFAVFAAMYSILPRLTGRPLAAVRQIRWQLALTHVATVGALVTFAMGGYWPPSIVFSSVNGVVWYMFVWIYWKNTAGLPRPLPVALRYLHAAVALLVLCSLGTWLVAGLTASGADLPLLESAALHLFLNNFIDGWVLVGLLGLVTFVLSAPAAPAGSASAAVRAASAADGWAAKPLPWLAALTPISFLADVIPAGLPAFWAVVGVGARTALAVPYVMFLRGARRRLAELAGGAAASRPAPGAAPGRAAGGPAVLDAPARALLIAAGLFFAGKAVAHGLSFVAAVAPSHQLFIAHIHLSLLGFFSVGVLGVLWHLAGGPGPAPGRGSSAAVIGPWVLAAGVAGMVLTLFGAAGADVLLEGAARARGVTRLLEAAFAFAVVSVAGIPAVGVPLVRRWR